jgi:hypothetical protein
MKTKAAIVAIFCLLTLGLTAPSARADTTALAVGDAYYLGSIDPGSPSSVAYEAGYINELITLGTGATTSITVHPHTWAYSRVGSTLVTTFPPALGGTAFTSADSPALTGINVTGYTYLLGKFGDRDYVWDVAGLQTVDLPSHPVAGLHGDGLSHYALFNPSSVPDGGMTLMLLGGALVGLATLRRKFRA